MIVVPHIAVFFRLSLLCTLNPGISGPRPPPLVSLSDLLAHKNSTKGCDRSHEKRDAGFRYLPKAVPYWVRKAGVENFGYSYDGDDDHHHGEAKEETQSKFLSFIDFSSSKNDHGNADDFKIQLS